MTERVPVALTIAGSDSGGGAGIEMDLKIFTALDVFGACAITALTAQNSVSVRGAWEVPPEFVAAQLEAVLDDLPVAAAKTGMLSSAAVVRAVVGALRERLSSLQLVVDPVVVAKDGSRLLSDEGIAAVREELIPLATIITPNVPEAEQLSGMRIESEEEARRAAEKLRSLGCDWVLVKGGHLQGQAVTDYLLGPGRAQALSSSRFPGGPFHGTGCALSAAIAAHLARGKPVPEAVSAARDFVQELLGRAQRLGQGSLLLHPTGGARSARSTRQPEDKQS